MRAFSQFTTPTDSNFESTWFCMTLCRNVHTGLSLIQIPIHCNLLGVGLGHLKNAMNWIHLCLCFWWLGRVTLVITFAFLSQNFWGEGGGNLWMVLCHSVNAGSVVGIPWGPGETQTLPYAKEFELFALTGSRDAKTPGTNDRAGATWWNFH